MGHDEGNTLKSQDNREGLRALPLKTMESSMKTCVFTPSYETGILVADIIPDAGSHALAWGAKTRGRRCPPGPIFFQAADGQGAFFAP